MKDKRLYLKLACLVETIYIIVMTFYYLFFSKFNDEVMASLFFLLIGAVFTIILYKESKKDIDVLKNNKIRIIFSSLWLFFEPVIPGVLGFLFLNSLKDKKELLLPKKEEDKKSGTIYTKAFVILLAFIGLMFILPNFKIASKVPAFMIYAIIVIIVLAFNYKELIKDIRLFVKNYKVYLPFVFKRYLCMLGVMVLVAIPVVLINKGATSTNQTLVNAMFKKMPFGAFALSVFYAPFIEENVFRLSLSKFFTNKTAFIIISGFLFGSLHVIDKFTSIPDLLFIFQYSALGICLAKAYADSKNIFVSISMHFIQNFLAAVLVLLLY